MLSLILACTAREVAPDPKPSTTVAEVAPAKVAEVVPPTIEAPAPVKVRVPPATLPAPLPEPPAPAGSLPPGTPSAEGGVRIVLALDDQRALVQFYIPGFDHAKNTWLALMRRDGSIAWVQPFPYPLAASSSARENVALAGEVVSMVTEELSGDELRLTLRALSVVDGAPRFTAELGSGFLGSTASDGSLRFDTIVPTSFDQAELRASSGEGVVWRATIGAPLPVGHDPTIVGDVIAVRSEERRSRVTRWTVFDRRSGEKRGELLAEPQSCSDGRRWFLHMGEDLVEVDPKTLTTRKVLAAPTLAGASGPWVIEDCTIAGDAPVALVARGSRRALVALDPATLAIAGHVELGALSVGRDGFDPLPARASRVVILPGLSGETYELLAADPRAGKLVGRWHSKDPFGGFHSLIAWAGGGALTTQNTVSVVDGDSGELRGQAVLGDLGDLGGLGPEQLAGDTLWLPPGSPFALGRRAPRVVSLAAAVPDEVRDAVLLDVVSAEEAAKTAKRPPCPDPRAVVRGDGVGVDPQLGPVARGRLPAWDREILEETARGLVCAPGTAAVRLMAWYVMEDSRPLRNDNALMLVEDATAEPPRFSLVSVYRHATNHEWNTIGSFHDRREPVRTFDHRPTRAEVDAFMDQAEWTFADGWGRVIAGNVVDEEWRAATGEAPWRGFAAEIERPD